MELYILIGAAFAIAMYLIFKEKPEEPVSPSLIKALSKEREDATTAMNSNLESLKSTFDEYKKGGDKNRESAEAIMVEVRAELEKSKASKKAIDDMKEPEIKKELERNGFKVEEF